MMMAMTIMMIDRGDVDGDDGDGMIAAENDSECNERWFLLRFTLQLSTSRSSTMAVIMIGNNGDHDYNGDGDDGDDSSKSLGSKRICEPIFERRPRSCPAFAEASNLPILKRCHGNILHIC